VSSQPRWLDRLLNWKFVDALAVMPSDYDASDRNIVEALATMYGNAGWFGGTAGTLIDATIDHLVMKWNITQAKDRPHG
jgi:hypothetical protein